MIEGLNIVISLVVGLLIAAAMQLLLTSMGVALGLTAFGWVLKTDSSGKGKEATQSGVVFPITHLVGFGVALSLSLVLFGASLLTVEFFQVPEPLQATLFGLILWAAYWLLLVWLSSTALAGLVNSLWETAIASLRQLIASIRQLFSSQATDGIEQDQTLLHDLATEVSQLADLQRQLPDLLAHQRETLIAEITERTDLSPSDAETIVAELGSGTSATREPGARDRFSPPDSPGLWSQLDLPSWQQLMRQLLNQVALSNLDGETLWQRLQDLRKEPSALKLPAVENVIRLDAEDYICNAPVWSLQPEVVEEEFYQRIYDPDAAPELVQDQLAGLSRDDFVDWLQRRGDLAAESVEALADQLCQIQQSVVERVSAPSDLPDADLSPALEEMQEKLLAYCRYTNLDALSAESLTEKVHTLRQELELPEPLPIAVPAKLDLAALMDVLSRRQGITTPQQQILTDALVDALGAGASTGSSNEEKDNRGWVQQARQRLGSYLEAVDWSTVSLEEIKPEMLNQLRSLDLRGELDWQSLGTHLQMPDELRADLVDWLQETGQSLSRSPRRWAIRASHSAQSLAQYLIRQITYYLKFQDKSAFQPEQMARDIASILRSGIELLPDPTDWIGLADLKNLITPASLKEILETRRDMTADQIQQVLGWFEAAWQKVSQPLLTWSQTLWSEAQDLLNARTERLDHVRQRLVGQVARVQQRLQNQADQMKVNLQRQADAARRQVAIVAWWFFFSLLSSAGAAMLAGWLAVRY
jgi:hypothetical protein